MPRIVKPESVMVVKTILFRGCGSDGADTTSPSNGDNVTICEGGGGEDREY